MNTTSSLASSCATCGQTFTVENPEREFLREMGLPSPPRNCPLCRRQRRLAFRNERHMYYRTCDQSGARIIALYLQESLRKIVTFEQRSWRDYSKMDPLYFGRDYDFSRPFFEQFAALKAVVPRPNLHNTNVENAIYGNHCVSNKDCYLAIGSDLCEGCYFTYWAIRCRDCFDCSLAYDCELCHSCVDVRLCFNCHNVDSSENMMDCESCYDCVGCADCFGCVGLRHKKYYILNENKSEQDYKLMVQKLRENLEARMEFQLRYEALRRRQPHCGVKNIQSENVIGDRLWRCLRCTDSFDLEKCDDVSHSTFGFEGRTCQDMDFFGRIEKLYEGFSAFGQHSCISTILCHFSHDTNYSEYCISCRDVFGSISLHHHKYCILNKQYTKEEYLAIVPRIIAHMKHTGEWGEFFPIQLSPFPYNFTVAQKYFPLTKEQIQTRGWLYEDDTHLEWERNQSYSGTMLTLPEDDSAVDASICKQVLRCEKTGRPYQIMPKEFEYLRSRKRPLPRLHQDERNEVRMQRRNPQYLWQVKCQRCGKPTSSSYDPAMGYKVYCTQCYEQYTY